MSEVTVFISVYNTRDYVEACIESVLAQSGNYITQILIIDDASNDGSSEIVRRYADYPSIEVRIHEQNEGATASWNEGFLAATGDYVLRLGSDDLIEPDYMSRTVPILEQFPDVGLVFGDVALIDSTGATTSASGNVKRPAGASPRDELPFLLADNYIPAPTCLARRQAWLESVPMPDWLDFCDWYQTIQIARGWQFFYLDEVLAKYRVHAANMHAQKVKDLGAERTTFRILDDVLTAESRLSADDTLAIYRKNYIAFGDQYFGAGMNSHARRCYWGAIRHSSRRLDIIRRLLATLIPRNVYEALKGLLR